MSLIKQSDEMETGEFIDSCLIEVLICYLAYFIRLAALIREDKLKNHEHGQSSLKLILLNLILSIIMITDKKKAKITIDIPILQL